MTYQEQFAGNVWAQVALEATWKAKLSNTKAHELAQHLCAEEAAGRIKHAEHRKQIAANWCKNVS